MRPLVKKYFLGFSPDHQEWQQGSLIVIMLAFIIFLLPVLNQISTYHSDERFYTDSALYMLQHQDYLTPHYADGSLRLNKPIATYWLLMASYAVCGINFFGARLPFLLIGCLTLWLTYKLALALFGQRRDALLAAAILASNIQFITLSLRATPDILQTLFLNLSLYGFVELLLHQDRRLNSYLFAYSGAALAVATKGLLGIAPVAFAFVFALFLKGRRDHLKGLVHVPVMLSAAVVAVAWFAVMHLQHGDQELERFFQDQVGDRLIGPKYLFLINLKDYLWGYLRYFMPWSLVALAGCWCCRQKLSAFVKKNLLSIAFIIGWTGLLLLIFCGGNINRTRYLIPTYPLMAILCASVFMSVFPNSGLQRLWRWICGILLGLLLVIGTILTAGGVLLDWCLLLSGIVILGAACLAMWRKAFFSPLTVSLLMLLSTACTYFLILPVFRSVPSIQVADTVLADTQSAKPVVLKVERCLTFARQLYVISNGRIIPSEFPKGPLPPDLGQHPLALLSQKTVQSIAPINYSLKACGSVSRSARADELWRAWRSGGRQAFFQTLREPVYLARRK